jgi:uncharacterized lipoprotein YddW (UPF0748 family)
MFVLRICCVVLLAIVPGTQAAAAPPASLLPPKTEVRAVWVTTAAGLDWPHVTGRERQQESLRRLVQNLYTSHFNTIFFQVRPRGDAFYRSRYEPWAEVLTGTLGKDPGWDPFAFLIEEAHALGMEVHGWFNVFKIRGPNAVGPSEPEHPSRTLAAWCVERDGELWVDPGRPEVRTYTVNVALDLIRKYDLDGINFDFIRYPGGDFPDAETFGRYGHGMKRDDWRRSNVTAFVKAFAAEAERIKPLLKLGSSPFGVHKNHPNGRQRGSYYSVYQDSYGWLENGWQDYLCPQVYWLIGPNVVEPEFGRVVEQWTRLTAGRHIYVGIGAYRSEVAAHLGAYIDTCRKAQTAGHAFFRWEDIADPRAVDGRYPAIALIPPMHWKDAVPPLTPPNARVTITGPQTWTLAWDPSPPARDGDTAHQYIVYRWTSRFIPFSNPYAIAAVLPGSALSFADSSLDGRNVEYFYAIAASDRMHNESTPTPVVSSQPVIAAPVQHAKPPSRISLSVALATDGGRPMAARYNIAQRTRVALDLFRHRDGEPDTLHAMLVRAVQEGGAYKVNLERILFSPGTYLMRLTTTEATIEQPIVIHRE